MLRAKYTTFKSTLKAEEIKDERSEVAMTLYQNHRMLIDSNSVRKKRISRRQDRSHHKE